MASSASSTRPPPRSSAMRSRRNSLAAPATTRSTTSAPMDRRSRLKSARCYASASRTDAPHRGGLVRSKGRLPRPVAYSRDPFRDGGRVGGCHHLPRHHRAPRLEDSTRRRRSPCPAEDARKSTQRIAAASDSARKHIERDIHDGAQQQLIAVSLRLEEARAAARDTRNRWGRSSKPRERPPRCPRGASRTGRESTPRC